MSSFLKIVEMYFAGIFGGGSQNNATVKCAIRPIKKKYVDLYTSLISVVICIIFSFLARRKSFCLHKCDRRPGIAIPMNALDMRHIRTGYLLAFGSMTHLIITVIQTEEAPFTSNAYPSWINNLLKIVGVFIYGTMWYPIFAAISSETLVGYIIGLLYALTYLGFEIFKLVACANKIVTTTLIVATFFYDLPKFVFMALLCIYFFVISIQKCLGKRLPSDIAREKENKAMADYVRDLLKYKVPVRKLKKKLESLHIIGKAGFVYPPRFICSMMVAALVLYAIFVKILALAVSFFTDLKIVKDSLLSKLPATKGLSPYQAFQSLFYGNGSLEKKGEDSIIVVGYIIHVLHICFIVSISLAIVCCIIHFLFMIRNYRRDVLLAYKGQFPNIRHPSTVSAFASILGFSRFTGYNIAYLTWGFIVQFCLFLIVTSVAALLVFVPAVNNFGQFWIPVLKYFGPLIVITVVAIAVQVLVTRFVFTRPGLLISVNNRQVFFVWTYYLFFYDIYLGLLCCLLRILESFVVGMLFVGRIDVPVLSRFFELFDTGFSVYSEFVLTENAHNNPVLRTFLNILVEEGAVWRDIRDKEDTISTTYETLGDEKVVGDAIEKTAPSPSLRTRQVRFQWQLLYSLHNNPKIRFLRKHYTDKSAGLMGRERRNEAGAILKKRRSCKVGQEPSITSGSPDGTELTSMQL